MSAAAVAADFHQAFDVQGFFTAKVPFHFIFMIQDFTQLGNFRFRQIPDTVSGLIPVLARISRDRVRPIP